MAKYKTPYLSGTPSIPTVAYNPVFPTDQPFPVTLASMQTYFPQITSIKAWTFEESSGNIIEKVAAGPSLIPSGTVHYRLWTPLAQAKKHVGLYTASNYLTTSSASAFNPAGASFTFLMWIRPENVYNITGYIVDALDAGNHGFQIWMEKGFGANTGQLKAVVRDGTTTLAPISTQLSYQYGSWMLVCLSYNSSTKTAHLITPEEDATDTNAAFVNASLVNTATSTLNVTRAHGSPFDAGYAYIAMCAGTITLAQAQAFAIYNGNLTGLTTTSPAQCEATTYDNRDQLFGTRVVIWGRNQVPRDWSKGKIAWSTGGNCNNLFTTSERLGSWTVAGSPTVTDYAYESPIGAFTATKIEKTGTGSAVGIHQSQSVYTSQYLAGVFLRADTPHTATIRIVGSHNNVFDTSQNVSVTTAWQFFSFISTALNGSDFTTFDFYIYPTDASNNATTGYIYAWGAQLSNGATSAYCSSNTVASTNGTPSIIGGTIPWLTNSSGWLEITGIPRTTDAAYHPWFSATRDGDGMHGGGIQFGPNDSIGGIDSNLNLYPSGNTAGFQWDNRPTRIVNQRLHGVLTWGNGSADVYFSGSGVKSAFPPVSLPTTITNAFVLSYDPSNPGGGFGNFNFERIAAGTTYLNERQVRLMAANAGVIPSYRVMCLGDSITGFYNSYYAKLNVSLGNKVICVNQGVSGDHTDDMIVRFNRLIADGAQSGWSHMILLGGINDILFRGDAASDVKTRLQFLYTSAKQIGMRVIACTLLPFKGVTGFGSVWSQPKQDIALDVNNFIMTQAIDVDYRVDLYTANNDISGLGDGYYIPANTYDGLHPSDPTGRTAIADLIFSTAFGSVALS